MFNSEAYGALNVVCGRPRARHNRDSSKHGPRMEPNRLTTRAFKTQHYCLREIQVHEIANMKSGKGELVNIEVDKKCISIASEHDAESSVVNVSRHTMPQRR